MDRDAFEQRRELRIRRAERRRARENLEAALATADGPAAQDLEHLGALNDRRASVSERLREVRAERRLVRDRAPQAAEFSGEAGEHVAPLTTLRLLPEPDGDRAGDARCPLCGANHEQPDPTAKDLGASLQRASTQLNLARIDEPRLSDAIGELDAAEQALRADLRAIEQQLAALLDRREAVRRAQGLLEEQAFVRGRIAGSLHEHPPLDEARVRALEAEVEVAAPRPAP